MAAILPFLANTCNHYLKSVYSSFYDVSELPSSRNPNSSAGRRKYTLLDTDAKWDILESARKSHTSARTALLILKDKGAYGAAPSAGCSWAVKKLWMYNENVERIFDGIYHINICNDGSSVDGVTYTFGLVYSWEKNEGGSQ